MQAIYTGASIGPSPPDVNVTVNTPTGLSGRVSVSNEMVQFDTQFQYDKLSTYWGESGNSGGGVSTHLPNESSVQMSTGDGTSGSRCRRRTHVWFMYQPGKPTRVYTSFKFSTPKTNLVQQVGFYSDKDGVYLRRDNNITSIVIRTSVTGSVVETVIPQSSWNVDKLDGTGTSGITMDWDKAQLLVTELLWLGVGNVGIKFDVGGSIVLSHIITNTNINDSVYIRTANLPITYEIYNNGTVSGTSSMKQICCSYATEGGINFADVKGDLRTCNTGLAHLLIPDTETPVIAIRHKLLYNSLTNRGHCLPYNIVYHITNAEDVLFNVWYGVGAIGGAWTSVGTSSIMECNITSTSFVGGVLLASIYLNQNFSTSGSIEHEMLTIPLTLLEDGVTQPVLLITGTNLTGGTAQVRCALNWKEYK